MRRLEITRKRVVIATAVILLVWILIEIAWHFLFTVPFNRYYFPNKT